MNGNIKMLVALMVVMTMTAPALADVGTTSFASGSASASGSNIDVSVLAGTGVLGGIARVTAYADGSAERGSIMARAETGTNELTWEGANIGGEIVTGAGILAYGEDVVVNAGAESCVLCDNDVHAENNHEESGLHAQVDVGSSVDNGEAMAYAGADLSGETIVHKQVITGAHLTTDVSGFATNGWSTSFSDVYIDMTLPIYD